MNFEWVQFGSVDPKVIDAFDSGDYAFNMFLKERAEKWQNSGEAVTYLCVNSDEINTTMRRNTNVCYFERTETKDKSGRRV